MSHKNEISTVIIIFVLVGLFAGVMLYFKNTNVYELSLPAPENVLSINITTDSAKKEIIEAEKIRDIISIVAGEGRKTRSESIHDGPVNARNKIELIFNYPHGGSGVASLYEKSQKYYIEQPYNGIYSITAEEYNAVLAYSV